jgi:hypothetical protein
MDSQSERESLRTSYRWRPLSTFLLFASLISLGQSLPQAPAINDVAPPAISDATPPGTSSPALLDVFQVYTPVHVPQDASCVVKLMDHSFGFSYGKPFVGEFDATGHDLSDLPRHLLAATLRVQPSRSKVDSHILWPPV